MGFKSSCSECGTDLYLFNVKKISFNCPICGKIIEYSKLNKKPLKNIECRNCGRCCQYVPELSKNDILKIKKNLKNYKDFLFTKKGVLYPKLHDINGKIKEYTTKYRDFYCIFYNIKEKTCSIHKFKPEQCRNLEASFSCAGHKEKGEVDFSLLY